MATHSKPTLLITGSSGYIGSTFVKHFAGQGFKVLGLDLKDPPEALTTYLYDHVVCDMADKVAALQLIYEHNCHHVIHCAAFSIVSESVAYPEKYFENNRDKATTFLNTCMDGGVKNFIFSSTAAVYGEPQQTPIDETHPREPINPYGASKKEFEDVLLGAHKQKKIRTGIFRYFNACGAEADAEVGEAHDPETHLIPNLINATLAGQPLTLFGNDYPTKDGTCVRDYIHVSDLASAHHALLQAMIANKGVPEVYNLGTRTGYSLLDIIGAAQKVFGHEIVYNVTPRRDGDPSILVADPTLARTHLDWNPQYSDLNTIVASALKWHQKDAQRS